MCLVKKPKPVVINQSGDDKERPILRNPLLDGLGPLMKARMGGTRALRIDRGTSSDSRPPVITPTVPRTPSTPTTGGGSDGGGSTTMPGLTPEKREMLLRAAPFLGTSGLMIRKLLKENP